MLVEMVLTLFQAAVAQEEVFWPQTGDAKWKWLFQAAG